MRLFTSLPEVLNGASATNSTVSIKAPIGRTYHGIYLNCTNLTLAEIEDIRIVINGNTVSRYDSGTDLNELNQAEGLTDAGSGDFTNPLLIPFDRHGLRTRDVEELTAIGTGLADDPNPVVSFTVEVDVASGATGATITADAETSKASASGLIREVSLFNYTNSQTGDFEISDIPRKGTINRIWFKSGNVDGVTVKKDNNTFFDRTVASNNYRLGMDGYKSVPSTDFLVDFTESGFGTNGLNVKNVNDLRFVLNMSGTGTIPVYVEYLKRLSR